jgi:hypothetical protein
MTSKLVGEIVHRFKDSVKLIFHSLENVTRERSVVYLVDGRPKLADFLPNIFEKLVILNKVLETIWVTKFKIKEFLSFADSLPVFIGLLDLTSNDVQGIKSLSRLELSSSWSLLIPLDLNLLNLGRASSLFFKNLGLKCWNLIIHELCLDQKNLLETLGPFEFYHINIDPILRELIPLGIKKFLTLLESIKLLFPRLNLSLDLFDVGNKHGNILRSININVFKLLSGSLDLLEELLDLLFEFGTKLVQNLLMPLVILIVHILLHCAIVDLNGSKAFSVIRRIEGTATLSDVVQKSGPLLDIVTKHFVNLLTLEVPQGLVLLPDLEVIGGGSEYFFKL